MKGSAAWISLSWQKDTHPAGGYPLAFRHDTWVPSKPDRAVLRITASPRFSLWINGRYVGLGPARCYPSQQLYDEWDITPYVQEGHNAFAVLVHKPSGVAGYSLLNRVGLYMEGDIWGCDGSYTPVITDASWKVREADWYVPTPYVISLPLGGQEHVDGQREPALWQTAEPGDEWTPAFCLGGAGTPPWKQMKKSRLPKAIDRPVTASLIWRGHTVRTRWDVRVQNLAHTLCRNEIEGEAVTQQPEAGFCSTEEENLFVFDCGKTSYTSVTVEVGRLTGNVRIELFYDIAFEGRPATHSAFGSPWEGFCDSFAPSASAKTWSGLLPRGFRFLTVRVTGEGVCAFRVHTHTVEYPYEQQRVSFSCNDPVLQKIWETSCVTLKAATTDVIAEPARENVLWIFDACVGGKAAYYSFGDTHMWRHCLELAAQGIDEDGVPHAVVPAGDSFMVLFDQVLFWVHSCREFYTLTGDKDFVKSVLPAIGRLLGLCKRHMTQDGLFIPPDYAWHWVDWAPLNKEPYSMPINGLLLLAAQAAMALEQALGAESTISLEIATLLQENLPRFYDEKEGAFRSRCPVAQPGHLCSINDTQPVAFDLHSNALAYMTGIGTREQRRSAVKKMVRMLPERIDGKPLFGIAWTQLILAPIVAEGYQREALQCLKSGYQPFLDVGAQTWGEYFVPTPFNSAHGWGACVNSLLVESFCRYTPKTEAEPVITGLPDGLRMTYTLHSAYESVTLTAQP